eukprot:CAMPEP_0175938020 /NCGR_PEP_ID=MMETSP0108-20121206/22465_1 /TAXON_ID=195067 ORGANISM="Goniomonas pacifica, Strain CCMP1869" /NCGR_SAMPLE_ID=MMETSP0108 /ASSEMBLY_ACC=CAM_ASM_000204 /LENGTH=98 /DNA_ID=CAMNT_0017262227 /DNA_START=703 /DNA_END=996 /DNA_ORIENTATION=+
MRVVVTVATRSPTSQHTAPVRQATVIRGDDVAAKCWDLLEELVLCEVALCIARVSVCHEIVYEIAEGDKTLTPPLVHIASTDLYRNCAVARYSTKIIK